MNYCLKRVALLIVSMWEWSVFLPSLTQLECLLEVQSLYLLQLVHGLSSEPAFTKF